MAGQIVFGAFEELYSGNPGFDSLGHCHIQHAVNATMTIEDSTTRSHEEPEIKVQIFTQM